jgi:hypothetical protein
VHQGGWKRLAGVLTLMGALLASGACGRPTVAPPPPANATPTNAAPSATPTPRPSAAATNSPSPTRKPALTSTAMPSSTPTPPATRTPTPTLAPTQTPAPTIAPTATPTGAPAARAIESSLTIPTYPYADFLIQEISETFGMPYARLDWSAYEASNPRPAPQSYRLITLENELLRLTLLPELGGRIYSCVLKATGQNVLYNNPVIKPTRWGPAEQGWWLAAGGIEFCLPAEEHGYETAIPWSYEIVRRPDAVSVRLWDSDAAGRPHAIVSVTLRAGEARFFLDLRLENAAGRDLPIKYWTNAMLAPGGQNRVGESLQFIFPTTQVTVHSTGDETLPGPGQGLSWPRWNGRDLSFPANWRGWFGFFERPAAAGGFAGVYDHAAGQGLLRIFPAQTATGSKGFGFGAAAHALSPALWTDDGSTYVELHGGLAPTFDDVTLVPAGGRVAWQEVWYPLSGLGGVALAGASGAAQAQWDAPTGTVQLRLTATRALSGRLEAHLAGAPAGAWPLHLAAGASAQWQLASPGEPAYNAPIEITLLESNGKSERWQGFYRPASAP